MPATPPLTSAPAFSDPAPRPVRLVLVGLGAIGSIAAAECLADDAFDVVSAVDPARAGDRLDSIVIASSFSEANHDADVALLSTASTLARVHPDLEAIVTAGLDVVSTCEELTLPWFTAPDIAAKLDASATAAGKTILGCGVNPGLMMDVLPLLITSASLRPRRVTVRRSVDLEGRRPQLSAKLGVGRPRAEWLDVQARTGEFGHFGLEESARLLAHGLGWPVASSHFSREPLGEEVVRGLGEVAVIESPGGGRIELHLVFEQGGIDVDVVHVDGDPPLELTARGGVQGDKATVARLLAAARVVGAMRAGLRLPIEVPVWASSSAM